MVLRKRSWKSRRATSLSEAVDMCVDYAAEQRRPTKALADLMGVELKTLYRWLAETSMPLNKVRQFETFCGATFISEYLCMAHGDKVVVDIPMGKKAHVTDLAELQGDIAGAITFLARFYQSGDAVEETVAAITTALSQLAYQRCNVLKAAQPELTLFGEM